MQTCSQPTTEITPISTDLWAYAEPAQNWTLGVPTHTRRRRRGNSVDAMISAIDELIERAKIQEPTHACLLP